MALQIKTLSPVHIGSGEKYNGLAYMKREKNKDILVYNLEQILSNITQTHYEEFISWIEVQTSNIEKLNILSRQKGNENEKNEFKKKIREAQRNFNLTCFVNNILNQNQIANNFKRNFQFRLNTPTIIYDNVDIDAFIKQNNKVYIPGSEIKGAIRTAILYKLLIDNNQLYCWLKKEVEEFGEGFSEKIDKVKNKRLEKKMREERKIKSELSKGMGKIEEKLQKKIFRPERNNDAKYDLLRHLLISDSDSKNPDDCLFVSDLKTLNTRQFSIFQELLKQDQTFTCERFEINNNPIMLDNLGFSTEQKNILSSPESIFECCYEFTNELIDEELKYFNRNNGLKIVSKLEKIKEQNQKKSPVIRIGKNEGYLSLTIGLLIKNRDSDLYNNVVIHATKNTSYTENFPKTRRIVNLGNNNYDTLGWVKLTSIK